ncbi:hypothetical protein D3C80_1647620 [compost metagenome]
MQQPDRRGTDDIGPQYRMRKLAYPCKPSQPGLPTDPIELIDRDHGCDAKEDGAPLHEVYQSLGTTCRQHRKEKQKHGNIHQALYFPPRVG